MKKDESAIFPLNERIPISQHHDLEYLGIKKELCFRFYKPSTSCKIKIPLNRINNSQKSLIQIMKEQYSIINLTEDKIELRKI